MTRTQSQERTGTNVEDLDWPLIVVLGAVGLVRPILSILGYSDGRAWLAILATVLITVVWIGTVLVRREPNPVATLAGAGGAYAVLAMLLNVAIQGNFSKLPAVAVVAILVTNLIWGAIAGVIAAAIQR